MGCGNLTTGNGTVSSRHRDAVQTPVLLTALVGILILLTVFGNVLVVIAVITNRALKAPQNLFLVSLACADILVATLVMPFSLANELMGYWYFGKVWCEIYLALDVLFCTSSIVHLCAISLDRYWSISRAVEYNAKRTPGRIKSTVFVLWALAAIISFPPLITMEKKGEKVEGPTCMINKEGWYIIFSSTASFFAPCLIMVLVYGRIYQIAKRRTRAPPGEKIKEDGGSAGGRRRGSKGQDGASGKTGVGGSAKTDGAPAEEQCSSSEGNETTGQSLKEERGARGAKRPQEGARSCGKMRRWRGRRNREKRLTFVLAVVVGVFVVCWFPFFFTYSLTAVCRACCVPEALFKMFFWFGYCNSSLNPVIYTVFNTDFRRAFKKILCRAKSRGV